MEQFGLLRIDYASFDVNGFYNAISNLKNTRYSLSAWDSDAPSVTHCVSAVRYIIKNATGWQLPHYYVGDMARRIMDNSQIFSSIIPICEGDSGDLIFFYRKSVTHKVYMITHVGILLDEEFSFHSTWGRGGCIDSISSRAIRGDIATCNILTRLTDPRGRNNKVNSKKY